MLEDDASAIGEALSSASMSSMVLGALRVLSSAPEFFAITYWTSVRNSARSSLANSAFIEAASALAETTNSSLWSFIKERLSSSVAMSRRSLRTRRDEDEMGSRLAAQRPPAEAPIAPKVHR